jgi:hypothetical protein
MSFHPIFSDSFYKAQAIRPAWYEVIDGSICMVSKQSFGKRVKEWFIGYGADPHFHELVKRVNQVKIDAVQLNLLEDEILAKVSQESTLQANLQALQHFIDKAKPGWLTLIIIRITNVARSIFHSAPIALPQNFPNLDGLVALAQKKPESRAEDAKKCLYTGELLVQGIFDGKSFPECLQKLELGSAKCILLHQDKIGELKLMYDKRQSGFTLNLSSVQEELTDCQIYAAFEEWHKLHEPRPKPYEKEVAQRTILEGDTNKYLKIIQSFTFKQNGALERHYVISDVFDLKPEVKYTVCIPGEEEKKFQFILHKK